MKVWQRLFHGKQFLKNRATTTVISANRSSLVLTIIATGIKIILAND